MIINFKIFEELNEKIPKYGDYVICKYPVDDDSISNKNIRELSKLIPTLIGQVVIFNYPTKYGVKYNENEIPEHMKDFFISRNFDNLSYVRFSEVHDIIYWSTDKEDLEIFINSKKYNL